MAQLGRLEKIDLRNVWQSEAGDFTPWLARDENLSLLGDTINIELELEAQEKNVGPFRADLLCKDTLSDSWVLIENQLERTDHRHLGQLMTYAAGLKAVTIVWVADRFTEEHRAALDWLNAITDDRFNFFALEVELWQIGDSSIAPKFNVVSKPNDWSRSIASAARDVDHSNLSELKLQQQAYWTALSQAIMDADTRLKPQKPRPQHWTNFALGRSYFSLAAAVNSQERFIRSEVYCGGPNATAHFNLLMQDKEAIEKEFGECLNWDELPEKKACRISIQRENSNPTNEDNWSEQHSWLIDRLDRMHRVFSSRVKQLDAQQWEEPESD